MNKPKHIAYRGHHGTAEWSAEDNCFFGKLEGIPDLVLYSGNTESELRAAFIAAVRDYVADGVRSGKYSVKWSDEDGEYVGLCSAFPHLSFLAKEPEAALRGIRESVAMAVQWLLDDGQPLPKAKPARRTFMHA